METLNRQFILWGLKNFKGIIEGIMTELNLKDTSKSGFEIKLILIEALTNAFKHGNMSCEHKPIYLRYTHHGKSIRFEIEDSGKGLKTLALPRQIPTDSLLNDCGRGLFLIQSFSDKIVMSGNTLIIEKNYTDEQ